MTRRERRRERRRKRWEDQRNATRHTVLLSTITAFSVASFLISIGKTLMGWPESIFSMSLGLAMLGFGFLSFGAISLWGVLGHRNRWTAPALVVVVLIGTIPFGWALSNAARLSDVSERLSRPVENPLSIAFPTVRGSHGDVGGKPYLVIESDSARISRDAQAVASSEPVDRPSELGDRASWLLERLQRERDVLGERMPRTVGVGVDRCVEFGRVGDYVEPLVGLGFSRFELTVANPDRIGVRSVLVRSNATDTQPDPYRFELSREGVEISVGGDRLAPVEGCPVDGPTVCVSSPPEDCEVEVDWERVREVLEPSPGHHTSAFVVAPTPDVPFQTVVTLMEEVGPRPGESGPGLLDAVLELRSVR